MIGSLVIVLPSYFEGGELIVEYKGHSVAYKCEEDKLQVIFFYSDCIHEVSPVITGNRVTITYNVIAESETKNINEIFIWHEK